MSGKVNFNPKYRDGANAVLGSDFKTVRTYVNGKPNDICFKFNQSFEENGQSIVTLTANEWSGKYKVSLGKSTEAVLSFDAGGKSQSKFIDLVLSSGKSKHTITLDLRGLRKSTQKLD